MGWSGEPGSWRKSKPARPKSVEPPPPAKPGSFGYLVDAVLEDMERPGGGVFGRRAVTAIIAVAVAFLLIEQQDVSAFTVTTMVGLLLGGVVFTFWPLVSGSWWSRRCDP